MNRTAAACSTATAPASSSTAAVWHRSAAQPPSCAARSAGASASDGPYQVRCRPLTNTGRHCGHASGPSSGRERVGLVGEDHEVGGDGRRDRPWPASGSGRRAPANTLRTPSRAQHVAGERVAAEHHPRPPPDRDDGGDRRHAAAGRPTPRAPAQPRRVGPAEDRAEPVEAWSSACSTVAGAVTQTADPRPRAAQRRPPPGSPRRSRPPGRGASARTRSRSGHFVPPTRATSRSAGWVHQSVAPTSSPASVAATASVSDGTS